MAPQRVLVFHFSGAHGRSHMCSVVRDKVKNFAKGATSGYTAAGLPCPPWKVIILDEADSMTNDAQSALRRTMETYSKVASVARMCVCVCVLMRIVSVVNR